MAEEESIEITEFELSEDLKESYENNADITFVDLNIKKKIEAFQLGTLLEVTKKIGSSIKIISVKEVDETLISSLLKR